MVSINTASFTVINTRIIQYNFSSVTMATIEGDKYLGIRSSIIHITGKESDSIFMRHFKAPFFVNRAVL